jgi:hypothetical protein
MNGSSGAKAWFKKYNLTLLGDPLTKEEIE